MRRRIMNGSGKTLLLIISLTFNLGACLAVTLQVRGEHLPSSKRGGEKRHGGRLAAKLNLSPEQAETVSTTRDQLFDGLRALEREMKDESAKLADLITAPQLDMNAIAEQSGRVATIRNKIQWRMLQHLVSIRRVLEPAQLELYKEFVVRVLSRSAHPPPRRGATHPPKVRESDEK